MILLLALQIHRLWNQTPKRKILVAQERVKLCDPLYVEWNRSQNLTLTLHRLSSPKYMHTYDGECSLCTIGKVMLKGV